MSARAAKGGFVPFLPLQAQLGDLLWIMRTRARPTLLRTAPRDLQLPAQSMPSRAHVRQRDFVLPSNSKS
jgi:hypothetical protein